MELGVPVAGENALQRYDRYAFDRIAESAFGQSAMAGRLEVRDTLQCQDFGFASAGCMAVIACSLQPWFTWPGQCSPKLHLKLHLHQRLLTSTVIVLSLPPDCRRR